jgi:hypothetical protein
MSRPNSPFAVRTTLALVAVGAAAFVLFLYALGAGSADERGGTAYARAVGLDGFAGLVELLEARGHPVSLTRQPERLSDPSVLVLTPQVGADADEINRLIEGRRYVGPTILILPKWLATPAEDIQQLDAPRGWVWLAGTLAPAWLDQVAGFGSVEAKVAERRHWSGMGGSGALPAPQSALALTTASAAPDNAAIVPLVLDEHGDVLAGYLDDAGIYPTLDRAAGHVPDDRTDQGLWPVLIVAEPDLLNNHALADRGRARLAVMLIEAALDGYDGAVVFDLTLAGFGAGRNLLTLAFEPPLLAATLCLLLAAVVIAWRAACRFGPPVAEEPEVAAGKRQLARNSAALVERAKRLHLLGSPYAAMVGTRLAARLNIRETDPDAREAAIARALEARGVAGDFTSRLASLRRARRTSDLLRAARELWTIERTVSP